MQQSSFNIYNASAGSGKTYTLAKSYLKILLQSKDLEQFKSILAITFTNKSVGEMKERIINMLKAFSSKESLTKPNSMFKDICKELKIEPEQLHSKSKKILNHLVHNYGAFDISTIDGFTHRVIRTFALDLKLPINFEVELDQERLLNEAVDSLISKAGTDNNLTSVLVDFAIEKADDDKSWDISYDFNKIAKLLVNENDYNHVVLLKDKTLKDFKTLKSTLKKDLVLVESDIVSNAKSALTLLDESGLEHTDFSYKTLPNHFLNASKLKLDRLYNNKLEENLENRSGLYSKKIDASIADVIESILPEIETHYKHQKKLVYHYLFLNSLYKNITPLSVLNSIQQELNNLKEEQNKMLISEFNSIISNEIKDQPTPFIYERLGEKYKHYFIDEFQDTSRMQWQNLVPLLDNSLSASNGSVMLVGDAKQAIYRWRGGEAEQFINLYNETENPFNIKPTVNTLNINYRSAESIVNFNNSFFEFLGQNYFNHNDYASLYRSAKQDVFNSDSGYVNLNFLEINKEDDSSEKYAHEVLQTVKQCIDNGNELSDICVLVRKRKDGVTVAKYLSDNGIAITSSETLLLKNSEKVSFLNSVLKFLTQPENNSLKIQVLSFVANHFNINDKHTFYNRYKKLSIDDVFIGLRELNLFINRAKLLQLSLYDLVEELIRIFSLNSKSDAYLQFYLDLVFEFTQKQFSDLTAFLDYFEKNKNSLSVISPENLNAVNIMTIHKSKGLEFPVVIFPYADLNIYDDRETKLWFPVSSEDFHGFKTLLINYSKNLEGYNSTGEILYNRHRTQLELDNINLFYVALTRAVSKLYVISKRDFKSDGTVNTNTFSGMLINYLQSKHEWINEQNVYEFGVIQDKTTSKSKVESQPLKFISIPKEDHNLSIVTKSGLLWDTKQQHAIERGNLLHLIFSKIKTSHDVKFVFDEMLLSGEISFENIEVLKKNVLEVIEHPELKKFYQDKFKIYNEHDIITSSGQQIRPDRLNINSNNEVVIIDYKTGEPKTSHKTQLIDYEYTINEMNLKVIEKLLIYVNDTIQIVKV